MTFEERCRHLVENLGLAEAAHIESVERLSGGVSCDVGTIDLGRRKICVKFALPKLRVVADWQARVERNLSEYAWLDFVHGLFPSTTPYLLGQDTELMGFAMEFIPAQDAYLWKTALLERARTREEGREVGDRLGRIHAASSEEDFDDRPFRNQGDFYQLRLEPYLEFTANRHLEIKHVLDGLVARLQSNASVLIHGDVSPKNIMFRNSDALFLDAECATMGDPSFDLAFCMNHLVLKSFHMPDRSEALLHEIREFWRAYEAHIVWENANDLEKRVAELLPALMLARVDGKSPVEYLLSQTQAKVRESAISLLTHRPKSLDELVDRLRENL